MTVKGKVNKSLKQPSQQDIDKIINRGGKTLADNSPEDKEFRFTLRISNEIVEKIDKKRKSRMGNISRNQWIVEAICQMLEC